MPLITDADLSLDPVTSAAGRRTIRERRTGSIVGILDNCGRTGTFTLTLAGNGKREAGIRSAEDAIPLIASAINGKWGHWKPEAWAACTFSGIDWTTSTTYLKSQFTASGQNFWAAILRCGKDRLHVVVTKGNGTGAQRWSAGTWNDGDDLSDVPDRSILLRSGRSHVFSDFGIMIGVEDAMKCIKAHYHPACALNWRDIETLRLEKTVTYRWGELELFLAKITVSFGCDGKDMSDPAGRDTVKWMLSVTPMSADGLAAGRGFERTGNTFTVTDAMKEAFEGAEAGAMNALKMSPSFDLSLEEEEERRRRERLYAEADAELRGIDLDEPDRFYAAERAADLARDKADAITRAPGYLELSRSQPSQPQYNDLDLSGNDVPLSEDDTPRPPVTKQSLVVLDRIGSADGSQEAKAAESEYGFMATTALPLTGTNDFREIEALLNAEWPWAADLNAEASRVLALARHIGKDFFYCKPLLLVGPPGVGKTRWARRLAEAAGVGFHVHCVSGGNDTYSLSSASRTWRGAGPSVAAKAMKKTGCANPVICIDEIEKAGATREHGSVPDLLLPMLEAHSAAQLRDTYLEGTLNARWITWVITANSTGDLPEPFIDRCHVLSFPPPRPKDFDSLMVTAVADIGQQWGCREIDLPLLPERCVDALRKVFGRNPSVRKLVRNLEGAMAATASGEEWKMARAVPGGRERMGFIAGSVND